VIDIYFDENYGKLYEEIENGKSEVFEYKTNYGHIRHMFIKREIPININDITWFDLVTPYGYGGPIIIEVGKLGKEVLINDFDKAFSHYCQENRIVSEFIRFHPVINNAHDFKSIYEVSNIRKTVGTNLVNFDDPFQSEFSKSCRKDVRRAIKDGVSYKITHKPSDIHINKFKEIYYSTMNRNEALAYYYFEDTYFNQCAELFYENIILVEAIYNQKTIAMGFYFIYNRFIHAHLSGTLSEFLHLSPAYILKYAITEWGKKNGYSLIHHGGGKSNSPEDSLFLFKKKFGKNTEFEFYVGKKIWNEEIYNILCEKKRIDIETDFFPAYRKEE
jgi:serine/alanine adding enzyme